MTEPDSPVEPSGCDDPVPNAAAVQSSRRMTWFRVAKRGWLALVLIVWLIGTLLQLFVRDRFQIAAPVFYALPWPMVVWFGMLAVLFARPKLKRIRWAMLIVVVGQLAYWLSGSISMTRLASDEPHVRLMFWNVCRGILGYDKVAAEINESHADVVALVEATDESQTVEFWRNRCPNYQPYRLGSGMFVLVKGRLVNWSHGHVGELVRYRLLNLDIADQEFTLLLLDIKSDPRVDRGPALVRIRELAIEHRDVPFLVAGDFNTPPESIHFDELRGELDKAYEVCGEGYRETWPVIAPVLDLDQVWGNKRIKWQRSWSGWSLRSDHRPVFVEFGL